MPYITKERREALAPINNCGELNFTITKIIMGYIKHNGFSYQICNDIVGALDNAKDEFRRRIQHKYEDIKIEENGDVYDEEWIWTEGIKK